RQVDLRRMDQVDGQYQLTYYVDAQDDASLVNAMEVLRSRFPGSAISLVEQNNLLGG
ncbi:MAG: hypothetical protein GYA17_03940, partial [Chloroflexi bacterium]|nr:hypothetical protein [Chloroflexota bacterium]